VTYVTTVQYRLRDSNIKNRDYMSLSQDRTYEGNCISKKCTSFKCLFTFVYIKIQRHLVIKLLHPIYCNNIHGNSKVNVAYTSKL